VMQTRNICNLDCKVVKQLYGHCKKKRNNSRNMGFGFPELMQTVTTEDIN